MARQNRRSVANARNVELDNSEAGEHRAIAIAGAAIAAALTVMRRRRKRKAKRARR